MRTTVMIGTTELRHLLGLSFFVLDVGGEGRHEQAWNLNPSRVKTVGADRGAPIPRLILGRAEAIPLPADSVDLVIVERTPLRVRALREIQRIISPGGNIVLRHALPPNVDPHGVACEQFARQCVTQSRYVQNQYWFQQTVFHSPRKGPMFRGRLAGELSRAP